jgi:hypothetical protein
MEVTDFDGTFKGSGQEVTILDTFEDQDCQAWVDAGHTEYIIKFVGGYPRVSDLTFRITPLFPCHATETVGSYISVLMFLTSPFNPDTDCMTRAVEPLSAQVERVTVEGLTWISEWGYENNLLVGIFWGGTGNYNYWDTCQYVIKFAKGTFEVKQSTFRNVIWGLGGITADNSQVIFDGNTFSETVWVPMEGWDLSNSYFEVSHNTVKYAFFGFWFTQGQANPFPYILSASTFNIHHNDITTFANGNAIILEDYDNYDFTYPRVGPRIIANIHHNHLTLTDEYDWGILGNFLDGAVVHQNTIEGTSDFGIVFGLWGPSRRGRILNNDLRYYTTSNDPPYKIWLAEGAENFLVHGKYQGLVLDEGVNNRIKGQRQTGALANQASLSLDPAMRTLYNQKMERLMKLMPQSFRSRFAPLLQMP